MDILFDLCVLLVKEKIKKVVPTTAITFDGNKDDDETFTTSLTGSTEKNASKRKRKAPSHFTFKADKLSISLFAPIETQHKKNSTTTGVPHGKTNKELFYDLRKFIIGGKQVTSDVDSNSSATSNKEYDDESSCKIDFMDKNS